MDFSSPTNIDSDIDVSSTCFYFLKAVLMASMHEIILCLSK